MEKIHISLPTNLKAFFKKKKKGANKMIPSSQLAVSGSDAALAPFWPEWLANFWGLARVFPLEGETDYMSQVFLWYNSGYLQSSQRDSCLFQTLVSTFPGVLCPQNISFSCSFPCPNGHNRLCCIFKHNVIRHAMRLPA